MGYTKLFSQILMSTVWRAPDHVRLVWITMLATADENGEVRGSVPGLADFARVSRAQCDEALEAFLTPDPDSTNHDNEGRRIAVIPGGWKLLNYHIYKHLLSLEDRRERDAARQRRFRQGRMSQSVTDVAQVTTPEQNRTEQNRTEDPPVAPLGAKPKRVRARTQLPEPFAPNDAHRALAAELNVSLAEEFPQFCDHHRGKGTLGANWNATLNTWIRNANKFRKGTARAPAFAALDRDAIARKNAKIMGTFK